MAYYYNGAAILAPLNITSNEPIFEMTTVSLKTQRASQGAQRWEITFSTATSADTEADAILGAVSGITTSDTMVMPQLPSVVAGNTVGTSRVISAGVASGLSAVTVVSDGIILKGSFIKFSNSDKLYMVTADVAAGTSPVAIYPPLRSAVTTSDTLKTGPLAVLTYYRSIDNAMGITFTDGLLSNAGSINLIEAL